MKTIKQIADSLGVDKQRVYRFIRKNHISEAHHDAGVMQYDDAAETLIISHFKENALHHEAHHDVHQTASSDAVIDAVISVLQQDLKGKDDHIHALYGQIQELHARLAETTTALVAAQQALQAEQALHAGTIQGQLTAKVEPETLAPITPEPRPAAAPKQSPPPVQNRPQNNKRTAPPKKKGLLDWLYTHTLRF